MPVLGPDFNYVGYILTNGPWVELDIAQFSSDISISEDAATISMNGFTPKVGAANHTLLNAIQQKELVLKITTGAGDVILIGSEEFPAFITAQPTINAQASGQNGYILSINTSSDQYYGFYNEPSEGSFITFGDALVTFENTYMTYGE